MKTIFVLLVLLLAPRASAWTFQPTTLDHLSLDVSKFGCNREPMTPEIPCKDYKGRVRLNWNVGLLNDVLKWRNEIHTEGTDSKLMTVGWHYVLAIPLPKGFELFMEHHSRHTMDSTQPTIEGGTKPLRYPVSDSYGIRIIFYEK